MQCRTIAELNDYIYTGKIRELIRVNETLHQMRLSAIAEQILQKDAKAVLLSGPSSSGKTTTANRLATQLRAHSKIPILVSMDNYYVDRDKILPGPDGKLDLEHINTIDTELFRNQLKSLLCGEAVVLPKFDFLTGKRQWHDESLQLSEDAIIIIEGLHALNPVLLPQQLDTGKIFKLYVCPETTLYLQDNEQIPASFSRLLRRIVRDLNTRGASVCQTMSMWESVRRGEKRWIYPYKDCADACFDSATVYELAFIKKHIYPLLAEILPQEPCYKQAQAIYMILDRIADADADDEIPPTSIIREFIGGNTFYK